MRMSFKNFVKTLRCAEVGVARGDNAITMLEALPHAQFYLIDPYIPGKSTCPETGDREVFIEHLYEIFEPYGDRVRWYHECSADAALNFKDELFDYVYIDAQHEYDEVLNDIVSWWPKVKRGGILAGHDYNCHAVKRAVDDYFGGCINDNEDWMVGK